jgi:hypothetical protein
LSKFLEAGISATDVDANSWTIFVKPSQIALYSSREQEIQEEKNIFGTFPDLGRQTTHT